MRIEFFYNGRCRCSLQQVRVPEKGEEVIIDNYYYVVDSVRTVIKLHTNALGTTSHSKYVVYLRGRMRIDTGE